MKRSFALVPAALLLATALAGCASATVIIGGDLDNNIKNEIESKPGKNDDAGAETPEPNDGGASPAVECVEPGAASEALQLTGEFGKQVTVTSDTPVASTTLEKSVVDEGDGDDIVVGTNVFASITVMNGANGELIEFAETRLEISENYQPWVNDTLRCSSVGDRVAVVVPAADVFSADAFAQFGNDGPGKDDSLIIITDLTGKMLAEAEGKAVDAPDNIPTIAFDADGTPEITIPKGVNAPEKLTVQTLIEGEGAVVEAGDTVTVHYHAVLWRDGSPFDSSWLRGAPTEFSAATSDEALELGARTPVIRGFRDALVGQTVGSRVVSIVPADDGGYGGEWMKGKGYQADDAVIFILDVLDSVPLN